MKIPNLKKWDLNPEIEGLLFFAQTIDELLFDYTIDTYKIPALNSRTLTLELLSSIKDLESGFLRKGAIEPMVRELTDALNKDPVIRVVVGNHFEELLGSLGDYQHTKKLTTAVEYLVNTADDSYFLTSVKLLKEAIHTPREKDKIARLTRIYINELISRGYAPQYIYFESDRFFFSGRLPARIDGLRVLDDYFGLFPFEERRYNVLFRASKTFNIAKEYASNFSIEILDEAPKLEFIGKSEKIDSFLAKNDQLPLFLLLKEVKSFDEFKTRVLADEKLFLFDSLAKYHIHRSNLLRSDNAIVYSEDQKRFGVQRKPSLAVMKRPDSPTDKLSRLANRTISNMVNKRLDQESLLRLIRAYLRHNAAIRSEAPENELLEFWSAIEVLFPPSDDGDDRIVQIVSSVTPFICSEYAAKLGSDLWLSIRNSGNEEAAKILTAIPEGDNPIEKCLALFAVASNADVRDKIYALLEWHPLLKNRIYSLSMRFSSADIVLKTLQAHIQRVSWQIRRIYRARNLIIHSGKTLPYASILVENVHSYLDRVLDVLNDRIFRSSHLTTIDQIVLQVKLESESHLRMLKEMGKTACTSDSYKLVLFGRG
jgi:hypothetical protein